MTTMRPMIHLPLDEAPDGALLNDVVAAPAAVGGRRALRVELSPAKRAGKLGVDFGDFPTFVLLPVEMRDGTIEVDVLGRLAPDAPDYARAFIGVAYRARNGGERYESVYVRPTNGRKCAPPPPRDRRAVQYYAYPDWKFDRLRQEYPDGPYEAGADIAPDEWITLRIDVDGRNVRAAVNGLTVLEVRDSPIAPPPAPGEIGLWVDIGTEGYFSNLRVRPR